MKREREKKLNYSLQVCSRPNSFVYIVDINKKYVYIHVPMSFNKFDRQVYEARLKSNLPYIKKNRKT